MSESVAREIDVRSNTPDLSGKRILNLFVSLLLLPFAAVILLVIYILFLLVEDRPYPPFFYRGDRLGKNKVPFKMYKLRTLRPDSVFEQQASILDPDTQRELKLGRFLRETKLDELPQLFNVILGDMNLVGPRPIRAVIFENMNQSIHNYDTRFTVKPGITGFAQFLTPSHTPKRIRSAIDNYYISTQSSAWRDLFLAGWTALVMGQHVVRLTLVRLSDAARTLLNRKSLRNERKLPRKKAQDVSVFFHDPVHSASPDQREPIRDINYRSFSFLSEHDFSEGDHLHFHIEGWREWSGHRKRKRARCEGTIARSYAFTKKGIDHRMVVVHYHPVSPFHRYLVDRYVLHSMLA